MHGSPAPRLHLLALAGLLGATLAGCGGQSGRDASIPPERRAALARVVVENRTDVRLEIVFRYAAPGNEVGIGVVGPGARAELAPVPAEEPLVFIARGPGFERRLTAFSLEVDQVWTWVIRADPEDPGEDG